ncbi:MAG: hypothetical protein QOI70_245 [Microbacteriaceae bacterium]|jgi:hypothetical protein|nr:hypothetical protein [Microbacteriaceae bacterium]
MPEQTDALNDAAPNDTASQPDPGDSSDSSALLSRLRVIEDQPLDQRAAAFTQIHDRLQSTLEGGDSSHQHG